MGPDTPQDAPVAPEAPPGVRTAYLWRTITTTQGLVELAPAEVAIPVGISDEDADSQFATAFFSQLDQAATSNQMVDGLRRLSGERCAFNGRYIVSATQRLEVLP